MGDNRESKIPGLSPLGEIPPLSFETTRLLLRAMRLADAEVIFRVYSSDPVATKYMSYKSATSADEAVPFIKLVESAFRGECIEPPNFAWLIQEKESGASIGSCGFGLEPDEPDVISGGYILGRRFWGQGYASEAWQVVVDWVKTQPKVRVIRANHHPDNPASGAVMRKVGMSYRGLVQEMSVLPNLGPDKVAMVVYEWRRSEKS